MIGTPRSEGIRRHRSWFVFGPGDFFGSFFLSFFPFFSVKVFDLSGGGFCCVPGSHYSGFSHNIKLQIRLTGPTSAHQGRRHVFYRYSIKDPSGKVLLQSNRFDSS